MLDPLNFARIRRLPVIIQTEATECGLACLAMMARYHGHNIDLNALRARYPVSMHGVSLNTIIRLASQLHLGARPLRLDLENLKQLQLPAILHWDMNHFVVLKKVNKNSVIIHDPARGERKVGQKELSDSFTGVALELTPTREFTRKTDRKKMRLSYLWSKLIGLKRAISHTMILSIILQLVVLASPFYLQLVVDEAVVKHDVKLLFALALGFGGLIVIQTLTTMMRSWTILYYGQQMSFQMVNNIFRHMMHLPTAFFEKRHVGDIISRINSTQPIQQALTQSLVAAIIDGLMAIITGIVIFIYSPVLGMIVLVSVILMLLATMGFYPVMRQRQEEFIITDAIKQTHVIESIRASTSIKLFSAQSQRLAIWRNLFADTINANVSYEKYEIFLTAIKALLVGLQTIIVVYLGAKLILDPNIVFTIGMLFAFMSYRQSFSDSMTSLLEKYIEFRLLSLHLDRIADIALTETEVSTTDIVEPMEDSQGPARIEVKDVRFRYSEHDPWVLDGINLTIKAGEFVALTGSSGGGKTTLLKLMLGLYLPTEGQVLINGQPLTDHTRLTWRRNMGVVMQDDQLLTGSIAENISFFDGQMDMERVIEAAHMAHIHDDIMAMPMNYQSLIGDMGSSLSGGQRQRVLLARALYKGNQTLFLDEGTANIDEKTEQQIVDVIHKADMTRIVVAHRPAFIKRAHRVIKIVDGQIAQTQEN